MGKAQMLFNFLKKIQVQLIYSVVTISAEQQSDSKMVTNLSAVRKTWVRSLGQEHPLEESMETHSSSLAWRIPWTEEPGELRPWDHTELDTTEATKQQRPHINAFFLNLFQYGLSQEIGYSSLYCTVKVKAAQSCQTFYDPKDCIQSMEFSRPEYWSGLSFPSQGIFPTQGSNPGFPHCRRFLYQLSHQASPRILEWVTYPFSRGSS